MEKEYYILINGEEIQVTKDVYYAFNRSVWREYKRRIVHAKRDSSYDFMVEHDFDGQASINQKLVDEIVEDRLLLEMLVSALDELTDDERNLIDALFYQEKSEREIAENSGITQQAVSKRKAKILKKLKKRLS